MMKLFSNMKIATKVLIGFIIVSVVAGGVTGYLGITQTSRLNAEITTFYHVYTYPTNVTAGMTKSLQSVLSGCKELKTVRDKSKFMALDSDVRSAFSGYDNLKSFLGKQTDPMIVMGMDSLKTDFGEMSAKDKEIQDLVGKNDYASAQGKLDALNSSAMMASLSLDSLNSTLLTQAGNEYEKNEKQAARTQMLMWIAIGCALLLSLGLGILIASAISRPLRKLAKAANRLSYGDTDVKIAISGKDEVGSLAKAFQSMIDSIGLLVTDTNMLVEGASAGHFDTRADESRHLGDYQKIVGGINRTLDVVVNKVVWYESLLDAVPLPLSVTDNDMNWTFINRAVEQFLGLKRSDVIGVQCSNWNAEICNTENCGIARLKAGKLQTLFEQAGMYFQVDTSYIHDANGEKTGHIEVVQDITARTHTNFYLRDEVGKLSRALDALAQGNLSFEYAAGEGDEYTATEREIFVQLSKNLASAVATFKEYVSEISASLNNMANGDISMDEMDAWKGDFSGISESLNIITDSFNSILGDINATAEEVASGTRQVSDGSQSLSQGATEQASAIEELTASLSEIANQTRQNALNAGQASQLAVSARDNAVSGNAQMKELQQAMTEINDASASISKIIKVIDEIAFQTNLLALNAAVEAARAGQHGKGFAVVAEEVRSLAQRSAGAAKETTAMIEESIKKVKAGTKIANETAQALSNIVSGVEKATELVGGIAQASNEQATAVAQVNMGIEQVSQVTQTNSATAEQSAAASEELSSQALLLKEMVGKFSLRGQMSAGDRKVSFQPSQGGKALPESRPQPGKPKISLNDKEFGKY
jgi:methyl-accepting chemotaxis protein